MTKCLRRARKEGTDVENGQCFSNENEGSRVRGKVATGRRDPERADECRIRGPHYRSLGEFQGVAGG
jgi:hypothetical protein